MIELNILNSYKNIFCSPKHIYNLVLGPTQPPIEWLPGALSLGVKRPGRKVDHPPPSTAQEKNMWHYTSTPQYVFMVWFLIKHRDNSTFTLTLPYQCFPQ
jgi:hypothetical protein